MDWENNLAFYVHPCMHWRLQHVQQQPSQSPQQRRYAANKTTGSYAQLPASATDAAGMQLLLSTVRFIYQMKPANNGATCSVAHANLAALDAHPRHPGCTLHDTPLHEQQTAWHFSYQENCQQCHATAGRDSPSLGSGTIQAAQSCCPLHPSSLGSTSAPCLPAAAASIRQVALYTGMPTRCCTTSVHSCRCCCNATWLLHSHLRIVSQVHP